MATVQVHRFALGKKGKDRARQLVRQVLLETEVQAKVTTAAGPYTTGRLSHSIQHQGPFDTPTGVQGTVGSDLIYARMVHNGVKVHAIFPHGAPHVFRFGSQRRPQLHFFWKKRGRYAFFPHIPGGPATMGRSHPGQKGSKYLTNAMRDSARRHGFRVRIREL